MNDSCAEPIDLYPANSPALRCCAICEVSQRQCRRKVVPNSSWCWQHRETCAKSYQDYKQLCSLGTVNPLPGLIYNVTDMVKALKVDKRPDPRKGGSVRYFVVKDQNYDKLQQVLSVLSNADLKKLSEAAKKCGEARHWSSQLCHAGTCAKTKKAENHHYWQAKIFHFREAVKNYIKG
jgi:hypothetical protein